MIDLSPATNLRAEEFVNALNSLRVGSGRNSRWPALERAFLVGKTCALCGGSDYLQAHHVDPFHVAPEKEMDEDNLWPLCMHPVRICHYRVGHWCRSWKVWNPRVREDSRDQLKRMLESLTVLSENTTTIFPSFQS